MHSFPSRPLLFSLQSKLGISSPGKLSQVQVQPQGAVSGLKLGSERQRGTGHPPNPSRELRQSHTHPSSPVPAPPAPTWKRRGMVFWRNRTVIKNRSQISSSTLAIVPFLTVAILRGVKRCLLVVLQGVSQGAVMQSSVIQAFTGHLHIFFEEGGVCVGGKGWAVVRFLTMGLISLVLKSRFKFYISFCFSILYIFRKLSSFFVLKLIGLRLFKIFLIVSKL